MSWLNIDMVLSSVLAHAERITAAYERRCAAEVQQAIASVKLSDAATTAWVARGRTDLAEASIREIQLRQHEREQAATEGLSVGIDDLKAKVESLRDALKSQSVAGERQRP